MDGRRAFRARVGRCVPRRQCAAQAVQLVVELSKRVRTQQRLAYRLSPGHARPAFARSQRVDLSRAAVFGSRARNHRVRHGGVATMRRRTFLSMTAAAFAGIPLAAHAGAPSTAAAQLAQIERSTGGRLGVFAIDTASTKQVLYRQNERFPMCSTFKFLLVADVLAR